MQDKLKIRIWHKPTKKMFDCYGYNEEFVFADTLDGIGTTYNPANIEDCEFLYCIGLKDKNNNLIFEGDIVRSYYLNDDTGKICFDLVVATFLKEHCCFAFKGKRSFTDFVNTIYEQEEYEIVGNIYENPSLLEKQYATK